MGGTQSKNPLDFKVDYSNAEFSAAEVQRQLAVDAQKAKEVVGGVWAWVWFAVKSSIVLLILAGIAFGIYYYTVVIPAEKNEQETLNIQSVTFGGNDYTAGVIPKVTVDSLILPSGLAGIPSVPIPPPAGATLLNEQQNVNQIVYKFSADPAPTVGTINNMTDMIEITLKNKESFTNRKVKSPPKQQPTLWSKLTSVLTSGGSGNQLPIAKDATIPSSISSASASVSDKGAYGMQYWMFIKDWNYNFGKEKHVLSRNDSSNTAIVNPSMTLHPTDNTMQIRVSVFPSSEGPAPANHSGSSDDVFLCEVPDIPLQSWFSVSITVFDRNMDVYINGRLVKSCVLSGVPKPAAGDIVMNNAGGFSGSLCGFYHYPRALTPSDAQAFYSAGSSCQTTESSKTKSWFNFGVYDAKGKEIKKYAF
jgi:hypothetical protein